MGFVPLTRRYMRQWGFLSVVRPATRDPLSNEHGLDLNKSHPGEGPTLWQVVIGQHYSSLFQNFNQYTVEPYFGFWIRQKAKGPAHPQEKGKILRSLSNYYYYYYFFLSPNSTLDFPYKLIYWALIWYI